MSDASVITADENSEQDGNAPEGNLRPLYWLIGLSLALAFLFWFFDETSGCAAASGIGANSPDSPKSWRFTQCWAARDFLDALLLSTAIASLALIVSFSVKIKAFRSNWESYRYALPLIFVVSAFFSWAFWYAGFSDADGASDVETFGTLRDISTSSIYIMLFLLAALLFNVGYSIAGERLFKKIGWPYSEEMPEIFPQPGKIPSEDDNDLGKFFARNQTNMKRLFREKLKFRISANNNVLTAMIISLLTIILIINTIGSVQKEADDARRLNFVTICHDEYDKRNERQRIALANATTQNGSGSQGTSDPNPVNSSPSPSPSPSPTASPETPEGQGEVDDGSGNGNQTESATQDEVDDDGDPTEESQAPTTPQTEQGSLEQLKTCVLEAAKLQGDIDATLMKNTDGGKVSRDINLLGEFESSKKSPPSFWSQLTPEYLFGVLTRLVVILLTQSLSLFFLRSYQRCLNRVNALTDEMSLTHRKSVGLALLQLDSDTTGLSKKERALIVRRFLDDDVLLRRKAIAKAQNRSEKSERKFWRELTKRFADK